MIWITSFGSNTAHSGYETLCVEEALLRLLKALCPDIDCVDFVSMPAAAARRLKASWASATWAA